jgi:O-antigen/teichoic acid export membrane protein
MIVKKALTGALKLSIASVAIRLLSLLTFPILTRILSPEHYGIASLATTFIGIFTILAIAGQDSSYVKSFHDNKNYSPGSVDTFYAKDAWNSGLLASGLSIILWLLYTKWQVIESSPLVSVFIGLGVLGSVLASFSQVRARLLDKYNVLTIAVLLSGVTSALLCISAAIYWRNDEVALMLAISSYWVIFLILPKYSHAERDVSLNSNQIKSMICIGLPLLMTAPGYWIISSSDRWFLAANVSSYELGIYSVGVTVASLGQMVTSALCNVWYPLLSRHLQEDGRVNYDELQMGQTIIIWILMTVSFGICLFGQDILLVMASSEYQSGGKYIPVVTLGLLFYGINQFQGFGFTLNRKNHIVPVIWLAGVVLCIILNFILIPKYHGIGAATSQCIAYLFLALLTWWFSRSFMPFQPRWRDLAFCFFGYSVIVVISNVYLLDMQFITRFITHIGLAALSILVTSALMMKTSPIRSLRMVCEYFIRRGKL